MTSTPRSPEYSTMPSLPAPCPCPPTRCERRVQPFPSVPVHDAIRPVAVAFLRFMPSFSAPNPEGPSTRGVAAECEAAVAWAGAVGAVEDGAVDGVADGTTGDEGG